MSLECGYCERDLRGPHADDCNRPPPQTEEQKRSVAKNEAHRALDAAEKAWHAYAALCDVGQERTQAFEVFENVRMARMV